MAFKSIAGGYELTEADQKLVNVQRAITKYINDKFVQVGAIFLKTSSKNPFDEEGWASKVHRDTDLQSWVDDPEMSNHNAGFNLQQGWMDVDIDADDPEYNECIIAALKYLGIDARFRFGRKSVGCATHVLCQLGEEEAAAFDKLKRFEPKEWRMKGKRFHTQLRSFATNIEAKNLHREAKQTVIAGSIYSHKKVPNAYDLSVWYTDKGVAENVRDIAATTPRRVNFNEVVRAIAFGTFLYVVRDQWVEGSRQSTAQKVTGWLARVIKDSQAMNNHDGIATDVFCPIDDISIAENLLAFVCDEQGDEEKHMRIRALNDAVEKLERNADAKIPGWPAMEQLFSMEGCNALRTVVMPGSDVSELTKMAERYIYDETDNMYIDRIRFLTQGNYVHEGSQLERRHKGDTIRISGKPKEAFRVYESSDMRKRVGFRDTYPDLEPGAIYRISGIGDVLSDDSDADPTELAIFNTWRGWPIQPSTDPKQELLTECDEKLSKALAYITRDNENQAEWLKDWTAWIFQHPGKKQQIAPVIVGDQGVGKSWWGNVFMKAIMGHLWGTASPKVMEGDFVVEPFLGKMFVFIDEAKFHSEAGTDEIKKMIRNVEVSGAEKFESTRNHRIFARLAFASNRFDMNIGQQNTRDRALFYMRTYDKAHLSKTEMEFRAWAETLKPFFDEFTDFLQRREVKEHYVYMFMNREVNRHKIESLEYSSSNDPEIVESNMSWPRRIAKYIIEDGRVFEELDITTPFMLPDLYKRVTDVCTEMGFSRVQGSRVHAEFKALGLIEEREVGGKNMLIFTHKIGSLHELFGAGAGVHMEPRFTFDAEKDYGPNDWAEKDRRMWRGGKQSVVAASRI